VVWEQRTPVEGALDHDLVLGAVDGEEGTVLVATPSHQRNAVVSGKQLVWQEGPIGSATTEILACRLGGRHPDCDPIVVAGGPFVRGRPMISGRRIVYHEVEAGSLRLKLCELERGDHACRTRRVAEQSAFPSRPFVDGRRLLWLDRRAGIPQLVTCLLDPETGACPEVATDVTTALFMAPVGLSGHRVAWYELTGPSPTDRDSRLRLCTLDGDTGACPPVEVASDRVPFDSARLSGRRLVWDMRTPTELPDVFFCVHAGGRCITQRITSELGEQANPAIEGRRLVWQDNRTGFQRIAVLELPELAPIRDQRVTAGHTLAAAGARIETLGARLDPHGPRHALFRWRPRTRHVGEHVLLFRAERPGGLFDEREVRISVRAPHAGSHGAGAGRDPG
jgi:beta propeller repeat protein